MIFVPSTQTQADRELSEFAETLINDPRTEMSRMNARIQSFADGIGAHAVFVDDVDVESTETEAEETTEDSEVLHGEILDNNAILDEDDEDVDTGEIWDGSDMGEDLLTDED